MPGKAFVDFVTKKVKEKLPAGYENLFPFIMGIIETESNFNPYAARYEKDYRWLVSPQRYYRLYSSNPEIEEILQKTSLGLMQVMGAVYRELGYSKPLPAVFEDIDAQISYGIRHFLKFYKKYGTVHAAIAAYNAGSPRKASHGGYVNQGYVDRVVKNAEKWRK
jgi:soluble lytic murein transglycosylase-like protein